MAKREFRISGDPRLAALVEAQLIGGEAVEVRARQAGAFTSDWVAVTGGMAAVVSRWGNLGSAERRITGAEYFVDLDPGPGNAVPAPVSLQTNGYSALLNSLPVNIQMLRAGNHWIGVRFRNASGRWGQPLYRGMTSHTLFGSPDVTPPVITLTGGDNVSLPYGQAFTEPGYTAVDETDGNLTAAVTISGEVAPLQPGQHTLRYRVRDKAGNVAEQIRTVQVVDPTTPAITGPSLLAYNDPPSFMDIFAGLAASDAEAGSLTHRLRLASGSVNWFQSGTYPLVFEVMDAGGNTATFNRSVSLTPRATQYPPFPMWMSGHAAGRSVVPEMLEPAADPDADGLTNLEEWNADTDPFDRYSDLRLTFGTPAALHWCGQLRINYRLDSSLDLGSWQPLTGLLNTDAGADFEVDFSTLPGANRRRFFRLLTQPRMPVLVEP